MQRNMELVALGLRLLRRALGGCRRLHRRCRALLAIEPEARRGLPGLPPWRRLAELGVVDGGEWEAWRPLAQELPPELQAALCACADCACAAHAAPCSLMALAELYGVSPSPPPVHNNRHLEAAKLTFSFCDGMLRGRGTALPVQRLAAAVPPEPAAALALLLAAATGRLDPPRLRR